MVMHFVIGRSEQDLGALFNFREKRGIVRANTQRIADGLALEKIPEGASGHMPGMVLAHAKWSKLYFVREREGWGEEEYFKHAERMFTELGIERP